ncbi:prephenate dehydrogenase/arogenate dehydrogenase family protein [Roseibacillus persicicus]|uniref:prephenate dehydrogenase n=1 Tax=Roseibacillus persicicus TaxID=454148 RepID=UPI00398A9ABF
MAFETVAVLGPGLLGGSVGLAAKERGLGEVRFWGRSEEKLLAVREAGFFASVNLKEVLEGVELVILATPVEFYPGLAQQLVAAGGDYVVTDVGSVKGAVAEGAGRLLAEAGIEFVGSHPMAGSEQGGFGAAKADLFAGACCFLCPEEGNLRAGEVQGFWESLGCQVTSIPAREHDQVVARISHLPHILAAVGARVALRNDGEGDCGGGGLVDTTRVAAGNPAMWTGILLGNREAVLAEIAQASRDLEILREHLADSDESGLQHWLSEAKVLRDRLNR